jgi:hypothetical protein
MFKGPGATAYDFSHWRPFTVGAALFVLCLLGSLNTFYDQFQRVSQLPADRDELTPLQNLSVRADANRLEIAFTLECVFSITRENFLRSLTIEQRSGIFSVTYARDGFLDYAYDGHSGSFRLLSPIWGTLNVEVRYLSTPLLQQTVVVPRILVLYPGTSLGMDAGSTVKLTQFCIRGDQLTTFFYGSVAMDDITFGNGRTLAQSLNTNANDYNAESCEQINESVHIFAEPPDNNPLSLLKGLFGPIADLQRVSPGAKIAVVSNGVDHPFKKFLGRFNNLIVLSTETCACFEEGVFHVANSDNVASFRASFQGVSTERVVTFLLSPGANVENATLVAGRICEGCTPAVLHIDDNADEITAAVLRSKAIVAQSVDYLGWAFLLDAGSTLAVMSEGTLSDPWLVEFVGFLRLMFTILRVKTSDDIISVL